MAWLDDHPPASPQFRDPRRARPTGLIVVHTAESVMDTVGPDTGAEAVANFIRTRDTPGSYHDLVDSDSSINLVRYDCEAFQDGTGSNRYALSLSFACSYLDWGRMSPDRSGQFLARGVTAAVKQAKWIYLQTGIRVPARRLDRATSEAGLPGFISHAERDPDRRKDPGNAPGQFPWATFLRMFEAAMHPSPTLTPTEDAHVFAVSPNGFTWLFEEGRMTLLPPGDAGKIPDREKLLEGARCSSTFWDRLTKDRTRYEAD